MSSLPFERRITRHPTSATQKKCRLLSSGHFKQAQRLELVSPRPYWQLETLPVTSLITHYCNRPASPNPRAILLLTMQVPLSPRPPIRNRQVSTRFLYLAARGTVLLFQLHVLASNRLSGRITSRITFHKDQVWRIWPQIGGKWAASY